MAARTPSSAERTTKTIRFASGIETLVRLVVTPTTVKSHINHAFAKAGLRDRAQAVRYAYARGLAQPPS